MAGPPPPPFPIDKTGDVTVTITPERVYKLASSHLRANSSILMLKLQPGFARSNRFHLALGHISETSGFPSLHILALDNSGSPAPVDNYGNLLALDAFGAAVINIKQFDPERGWGARSQPIVEAWEIVLAALTRCPFSLPPLGIRWPKEEYGVFAALAMNILWIAKSLACVDLLVPHIKEALFTRPRLLSEQISHKPAIWLNLAREMRDKWLYKEAIIHAVGWFEDERVQNAINDHLYGYDQALIVRKMQELKAQVQRTVHSITSELGTTEGDRAMLFNTLAGADFNMAIVIFRDHFRNYLQLINTGMPWDWGDFGFCFCMAIAKRGYLPEQELRVKLAERGVLHEPHRTNILAIVHNLKAGAAVDIQHLLHNNTDFHPKDKDRQRFTCTVVDDDEVPFTPRA